MRFEPTSGGVVAQDSDGFSPPFPALPASASSEGPAFCCLLLSVSQSRLNCGSQIAHPLAPPLSPPYPTVSFLRWAKAQCFRAEIMRIPLSHPCFWERSGLLTWRLKSPLSLLHPGGLPSPSAVLFTSLLNYSGQFSRASVSWRKRQAIL